VVEVQSKDFKKRNLKKRKIEHHFEGQISFSTLQIFTIEI
jgi:hypothetical protein